MNLPNELFKRHEKIFRLRQEIQSGTYREPDSELWVDGLLADLRDDADKAAVKYRDAIGGER